MTDFFFFFRNLIQVRCSLEDVAENHIASALARSEKEFPFLVPQYCKI